MDWTAYLCIYILRNNYMHTQIYIKKLKKYLTFSLCVYVCVSVCMLMHHDLHVEVTLQHSRVDSFLLPCVLGGEGHWTQTIKLGGKYLYPLSLLLALKQAFGQETFVSCQQVSPSVVGSWVYLLHQWSKSVLACIRVFFQRTQGSAAALTLCCHWRAEMLQRTSIITLTSHITPYLGASCLGPFSSVVLPYWPKSLYAFFFFKKKNYCIMYLLFSLHVHICMWAHIHHGTFVEVREQLDEVQFSSSTTWVLWIDLRSWCLVAVASTHGASSR